MSDILYFGKTSRNGHPGCPLEHFVVISTAEGLERLGISSAGLQTIPLPKGGLYELVMNIGPVEKCMRGIYHSWDNNHVECATFTPHILNESESAYNPMLDTAYESILGKIKS